MPYRLRISAARLSFFFIAGLLGSTRLSGIAAGADLPPEMRPAGGARGEQARALQIGLRPVWKSETKTLKIVAGEKPTSLTLTFPGVKCPRMARTSITVSMMAPSVTCKP